MEMYRYFCKKFAKLAIPPQPISSEGFFLLNLYDKATGEMLATRLSSVSLDETIRLSGGTIDQQAANENVKLNGKYYFYDDLNIVPDKEV